MTSSHKLGLSTCWHAKRHLNAADLLSETHHLGFSRLEVYSLHTHEQLTELSHLSHDMQIDITSLHSPCPVPVDHTGSPQPWVDALASTNNHDRTFAVDIIRRSIDAATAFNIPAVIIHLGRSSAQLRQRHILSAIQTQGRGSLAHRNILEQALHERQIGIQAHLEAALTSIRALGEHAKPTSVKLGVEVRNSYRDIPNFQEMDIIFESCRNLPVGYWHDTGHAAKLEYCGLDVQTAYLERYGDRLIGIHIHDLQGHRDHRAPGHGNIAFSQLTEYIRSDTILTLELDSTVPSEAITQSVTKLLHDGIGNL